MTNLVFMSCTGPTLWARRCNVICKTYQQNKTGSNRVTELRGIHDRGFSVVGVGV